MVILVFLCLRVLLLRIDKEILDETLKSLWPSILYLIQKNIENNLNEQRTQSMKCIFKFLLTLPNNKIGFDLFKWAFINDDISFYVSQTETQ